MENPAGTMPAPRAKLWREGLRLFRQHLREWVKWAAWFFVIMAILQVIVYDPSSQETIAKINAAHAGSKQAYTPEETAAFMHVIFHSLVGAIPFIIVGLVQAYAYIIFFMKRQQPLIGTPELSVGRFFYWVWKNFLMFLLLFASMLILVGLPAGVFALLMKINPMFAPAAIILGLIGGCFSIFISFRITLVPTLAACAATPVFKTSWRLMKGNCWRVFLNALLLLLIILAFWIIAMIVERAVSEILFAAMRAVSPETMPAAVAPAPALPAFIRFLTPAMGPGHGVIGQYVQIVFDTLNVCVLTGLLRAFYCASTRVFYEEQQMTPAQTGGTA